jgi:hypothetical protein
MLVAAHDEDVLGLPEHAQLRSHNALVVSLLRLADAVVQRGARDRTDVGVSLHVDLGRDPLATALRELRACETIEARAQTE